MNLNKNRILALLAILALCAVTALVAGDHHAELQTLKLEDFADGESRTFGEGDHKVVVTRNGDKLSVKIDGLDGLHGKHVMIGGAGHDIECGSDDGDCNIWVSEDGNIITLGEGGIGGHAMFFSDDGAHGDIEKEVHVVRIGEGGENTFTVDVEGEGGPHIVKMIGGGHHAAHGNAMFITSGDSDKTVLRCEEGDTTMTVDSERAEEVFFCPQHKTELKPVVRKVIQRKIEVKTHADDDDKKKDAY